MRIAYRGNFEPIHSTETHVAWALEDLGHEVVRCQEHEIDWDDQLDSAEDCDLFLWTSTQDLADHWSEADAFHALAVMTTPSASLHLDLYLGLDRERRVGTTPFWRTDWVFTADGDPRHAQEFERRGIRHRPFVPGVHGPECVLGTYRAEFDVPVAFVGAHGRYHRESRHRFALVRFLRSRYGEDALWPKDGALRNMELNDFYASARVIVGDSCNPGPAHRANISHYWSDRVYETIGRGGFLLFPFVEGLDEEFVDGEHLRFYEWGDFGGLRRLVDYYLEHEDERERIRRRGQAHVREHFTYTHRLRAVLDQLRAEGAF